MYAPDPNIVRQLKECDPDLDVRWDHREKRWWVTCMGKDVKKVRESDGGYRPLDHRVVEVFRYEAWVYRHKFGRLHMHDKQMFDNNIEVQRKQKDAQRDDFRQYAKEEIHPRVVGVGGVDGRRVFGGWSASA